jgi:non-homologous end joining protein Ku
VSRAQVDQSNVHSLMNATLQVGPVRAPVALVVAIDPKDVSFRTLHGGPEGAEPCGRPLRQELVCPAHGKVPAGETMRGYAFTEGVYVRVDDEDLVPLEHGLIKVTAAAPAGEVPALLHDRRYYLAPSDDEPARRAYLLILRALEQAGLAGCGQFVMRGRDYPFLLEPVQDVGSQRQLLSLVRLHPIEDVRSPRAILKALAGLEPSEEHLARLVDVLNGLPGKLPIRHGLLYRQSVRRALDAKVDAGDHIQDPDATRTTTVNLDQALATAEPGGNP